jgi:hypothetical protein
MLTVLIIRGATLSGAMEGVRFYVGTVNLSVLKNPTVRKLSASVNSSAERGSSLGLERGMYAGLLRPELLQRWSYCHGLVQ